MVNNCTICDYRAKRNSIIPLAEKVADEKAGRKPMPEVDDSAYRRKLTRWGAIWNRTFFRAMDVACDFYGV